MVRQKGLLVAGLMVATIALLGAQAFVQTAHPLRGAGSSATMASAMGGACPSTGATAADQSCQDIHSQFMAKGELTAKDYARIVAEIQDSESITCLTSPRNTTASLQGVI